jgi:hypothetical protein
MLTLEQLLMMLQGGQMPPPMQQPQPMMPQAPMSPGQMPRGGMPSHGMPPGTQFSAGRVGPMDRGPITQDPRRMAQMAMGGMASAGLPIGLGAGGMGAAGGLARNAATNALRDPAEAMFARGLPGAPGMGGMGGMGSQAGRIDPRLLAAGGAVGVPAAAVAPDIIELIKKLRARGGALPR